MFNWFETNFFIKRFSTIEESIINVPSETPAQINPSYSQVLQQADQTRIDKLEYISSETERNKRSLQVTITHPTINNNEANLQQSIKRMCESDLNMERRDIDANMMVKKVTRENTVLITFSHRRYKINLFKAKKLIRTSNASFSSDLYINENLTTYNFKLLMQLKREKNLRREQNKPSFETVYTFEGKVYVKRSKEDSNQQAHHIRSPTCLTDFLLKLNSTPTAGEPSH